MEIVEDSIKYACLEEGELEGEWLCLYENGIEKVIHTQGPDQLVQLSSLIMDDCLKPKQIDSRCFVEFELYENSKLETKIYQVEKEIKKNNQAWVQISKAITLKQVDKADLLSLLYTLAGEELRLQEILNVKKNKIDHLNQAMVKLHTEVCPTREKSAELNYYIRSLSSRMQHGKNTLVKEKHLLTEIKQLEGMRDAVIASESKKKEFFDKRRDYVYDCFESGWGRNFRNQVKFVGVENLGVVKKQKHLVSQRIKHMKELVKHIGNEISLLQLKLTATEQKKNAEYEHLLELKKQWENEVENFGDGYVKIKLSSFDNRHLDIDGQMRNPDDDTFSALNLQNEDSNNLIALGCVDFKEEKEEFEEPDKAIYTRNMIDRAKSKEKRKKLADREVAKVPTWTRKDAEMMLMEYQKNSKWA
ncbi:uncharacterized protein LOC113348815 [Papaver somniferum]|uniref:uncharacterized protein LOC113348815 n=1 Tax=Papaver somniferum TaxID=3469 RepID=UPI000E70268F|nr:uncharacterized protein LOC113348815 [Papaver somniferum]XP_026448479.1 uncharacterized protein LOC113348815 [Papaver somniferum]XP_026448481.1 uncharacterized protein LOC113348815 [Papaver somniferum]